MTYVINRMSFSLGLETFLTSNDSFCIKLTKVQTINVVLPFISLHSDAFFVFIMSPYEKITDKDSEGDIII